MNIYNISKILLDKFNILSVTNICAININDYNFYMKTVGTIYGVNDFKKFTICIQAYGTMVRYYQIDTRHKQSFEEISSFIHLFNLQDHIFIELDKIIIDTI